MGGDGANLSSPFLFMNKFERHIVNKNKENLCRYSHRPKLVRTVLITGEVPNYLHDRLREKHQFKYDFLEEIHKEINLKNKGVEEEKEEWYPKTINNDTYAVHL